MYAYSPFECTLIVHLKPLFSPGVIQPTVEELGK